MRRAAGSRVVLASVSPPRAHASGRYAASVLRAGRQIAELRWEYVDGADDETVVVAHIGGQRAWLEHRRAEPSTDPGTTDATAPHAALRLVTEDDAVHATAVAHRDGRAEHWMLVLDGRRFHLDTLLRRRPRRYHLRRSGDREEVGRVETCVRPRGWALEGPANLSTVSGVMCLWLVHLIDVNRLLDRGRPWHAPPEWTVLLDDTGRLAPGGFGGFATGGGSPTPT